MGHLTELQDRARAKVDNLPRSEQLIILKYVRTITGMEGRCEDLDHEINKAMKVEKANEGKS